MGFTLKIKAGPSTWLELEGSKKSILPPFGLKPDLNGVDTVAAPGPPDPPFYAPRILTPGGPVLCPVCVEVATLQVVAPPPPGPPQPQPTWGNWIWHAALPSRRWVLTPV